MIIIVCVGLLLTVIVIGVFRLRAAHNRYVYKLVTCTYLFIVVRLEFLKMGQFLQLAQLKMKPTNER